MSTLQPLPRSPAPLLLPLASLHLKLRHPLQLHSPSSGLIPPACPSLLFAPTTPLQSIPEGSRRVLLQSQLTLLMALLWPASWCPQDKSCMNPWLGQWGQGRFKKKRSDTAPILALDHLFITCSGLPNSSLPAPVCCPHGPTGLFLTLRANLPLPRSAHIRSEKPCPQTTGNSFTE